MTRPDGIGDKLWDRLSAQLKYIVEWENTVAAYYEPKEYRSASYWEYHIATTGSLVISLLMVSVVGLAALMGVNDVGLVGCTTSLLFGGVIVDEFMDTPTIRIYSEANSWLLMSCVCLLIMIGLKYSAATVCEVFECQFKVAWRDTGRGVLLIRFLLVSLFCLRYFVDGESLPCDYIQSRHTKNVGADSIILVFANLNMCIWSRLLFPSPFSVIMIFVESSLHGLRLAQCADKVHFLGYNSSMIVWAALRNVLAAYLLENTVLAIFAVEGKLTSLQVQRKLAIAMLSSESKVPLRFIAACSTRMRSLKSSNSSAAELDRKVEIIKLISENLLLVMSAEEHNFAVSLNRNYSFRAKVRRLMNTHGAGLNWGRRLLKLDYAESSIEGCEGLDAYLYDANFVKASLGSLVCYAVQGVHRYFSGCSSCKCPVDYSPMLRVHVELLPGPSSPNSSDSNSGSSVAAAATNCFVAVTVSSVIGSDCISDVVWSTTGNEAVAFSGSLLGTCSTLAAVSGGSLVLTTEPVAVGHVSEDGSSSPVRCSIRMTLPCASAGAPNSIGVAAPQSVERNIFGRGVKPAADSKPKSGLFGFGSVPVGTANDRSGLGAGLNNGSTITAATSAGELGKTVKDIDLLVSHMLVHAGLVVDEDDDETSPAFLQDLLINLRSLNVECFQLDIDDLEVTKKADQLLFVLCCSLSDCIRLRNKNFKGHIAYLAVNGVYANMEAMAHCDTILPVPCTLSDLSALKYKLMKESQGMAALLGGITPQREDNELPRTGDNRGTAQAAVSEHISDGGMISTKLSDVLITSATYLWNAMQYWRTGPNFNRVEATNGGPGGASIGTVSPDAAVAAEEEFYTWFVNHPMLPVWFRVKYFGETALTLDDPFKSCRNVFILKWLVILASLGRLVVNITNNIFVELSTDSRGVFDILRLVATLPFVLVCVFPAWSLRSLQCVAPRLTARSMWLLCGVIVLLGRVGFLCIACLYRCNDLPCTADEIRSNFAQIWFFTKSREDVNNSSGVVMLVALERVSYFAQTVWLMEFPWPVPLLNGLLGIAGPFVIIYTASRDLGASDRESNSLLVMAVCHFALYYILVVFLDSLLKKQFGSMRQHRHTEELLAEHYRRCSTDLLDAIKGLVADESFLLNIRALLMSEELQLSETLLRDVTSFHVGRNLLKMVELNIKMGADIDTAATVSGSVLGTVHSPSLTAAAGQSSFPDSVSYAPADPPSVTPSLVPVLKDVVRMDSFVQKLASAFDYISGTPIEVYVFVDPALLVVRTDRSVLQDILYQAMSFAEQNVQRQLRRVPASKDEIQEIIIRVYPAPSTTGVKAFAQKRMLTIEVIDSGFRIHGMHCRDPSDVGSNNVHLHAHGTGLDNGSTSTSSSQNSAEGSFCFAEHLCRKVLTGFGLKYQLSNILHYKYANKQELTMYYLPNPQMGPLGAPKSGMVRARHPTQQILKSFVRGRLFQKRALIVEGLPTKTGMGMSGPSTASGSNSSSSSGLLKSSPSSSYSHISGSILQRSGWEYNIVSDPERLCMFEGLQQCTVVIVDSLVFSAQSTVSPSSLVASLRSAGFQLAVVCLLQHSLEPLPDKHLFNGTITKPLHSCTERLLDIASISFLDVALWINDHE